MLSYNFILNFVVSFWMFCSENFERHVQISADVLLFLKIYV